MGAIVERLRPHCPSDRASEGGEMKPKQKCACGREFKHGMWNPKLWWHGVTLLWACPGLREVK